MLLIDICNPPPKKSYVSGVERLLQFHDKLLPIFTFSVLTLCQLGVLGIENYECELSRLFVDHKDLAILKVMHKHIYINIQKAVVYRTALGAFRESNSGPLAPKARIIPLDQMP